MQRENNAALPPSVQVRLVTLAFEPTLGAFDERPLQTLVADREVLSLREHFFRVGDLPYLVCVVTLRGRPAAGPGRRNGANGKSDDDPLAELDAAGRALFQTLRTWRSERARADGVPTYVIFNNRELAGIARARPASRTALLALKGVGENKVERYGEDLLRLVAADPEDGVA